MTEFTPVSALIGGALIGISSVIMLWCNGRIAGISGIFHGLFQYSFRENIWRIMFITGLMSGAQLYRVMPEIAFVPRSGYPITLLLLAGFLVGVGTRMSGGCTSGHGICGMARLSKRSIAATLTFMLFGLITVYVVRHILGVPS